MEKQTLNIDDDDDDDDEPYLDKIYNWTVENNLSLNADKSTATLFTLDQSETDKKLNLTINNILIPTVQHPKILGLTFDPKLNFLQHQKNIIEKANNGLNMMKALTSTAWGKQKETLITTYKTIISCTRECKHYLVPHRLQSSSSSSFRF